MIDLARGVGPVISYGPHDHENNRNQIWSVWALPGEDTVWIKSEANDQWLTANESGQRVIVGKPEWSYESAQWIVQSGDIRNLHRDTTVTIWNKRYADRVLDLEFGNGPGSPILSYKHHDGPNQIFRLWKRRQTTDLYFAGPRSLRTSHRVT
ncbi:hard-surface inducible [Fusarium pseudoanthophilum]|uniref:Hard-surface inducible n=1 Tax=Fusarium pseudoanthophilum TaxID=48495 RepID=A0A8H5KXC3_9HYPO|nr:hard-surface inducible [Fusarium pseudoanthophilum]